MVIDFAYTPGATPLDPDEAAGLIPSHISNNAQLNEWEMANILEGERWAFSHKRNNLLEIDFVWQLHKRMFGNTASRLQLHSRPRTTYFPFRRHTPDLFSSVRWRTSLGATLWHHAQFQNENSRNKNVSKKLKLSHPYWRCAREFAPGNFPPLMPDQSCRRFRPAQLFKKENASWITANILTA